MDERYWREFRARVRKRANMLGALFVCPFGIVVSIWKILEPMDYPPGDIRNSVTFRLLFYGLWIILLALGMLVAVRWLRADRRGPK